MRIVMIKEARGSADGINVGTYLVDGTEYEVGTALMSQVLADCFLDSGSAQEVKAAAKTKGKADLAPGGVNGG